MLAVSPSPAPTATPASLKIRVFACLARLADRDTYSAAASELESIGRGLDAASIAAFVSCIHSTDASDRSTVRKQCVRLLAVLAESQGDDLSPHLNKILSAVVRRLRDNDSAVRSACVASVESLRRHVSKPPFASFLKPLADALFTEQDQNSQIGAALCLAAAVEVAGESAAERIAKLMPRLERLLKCDGFKAKPAVLCLIGSAIGAGAVTGESALKSLIPCVSHFLISEEWAARKAAAEALARLAVVERNGLSEFKAGNLKNFESRRFDKVKAVREVMNQLLEAWKQIPDVPGDISQPQQSSASSKEKASDGGSKNPVAAGSESRRNSRFPAKSTPPEASYAAAARKRTPLRVGDKTASPSKKKPVNSKAEISEVEEGDERRVGERAKLLKPETKRALFQARVAPLSSQNEESGEDSAIVVGNVAVDVQKNSQVEWEDLSLIRNQLVQIEKQQTSLMDLLQRFIGSSQNGMRSLETRVHGLELALDEISYDLAVTTGRVSKPDPPFRTTMCCMPGTDFLSSKFWRRSDNRLAPPRAVSNPALVMANGSTERLPLSRGFQLQGRGIIVNPLAERQTGSAMLRH